MNEPLPTFSPRGLGRRIAEGAVRVIDVRSPAEFRRERIPDSENVPLETLRNGNLETLKNSANGIPFCLSCQSGVRAERAARRLQREGLDNVYLLTGGLDNWNYESLPTEGDGAGSLPLDRQVRLVVGSLILASAVAGFVFKTPYWFAAPAFFGAGLVFSGLTGFCGLARILARMPWNR